jgi:hypothetical protein
MSDIQTQELLNQLNSVRSNIEGWQSIEDSLISKLYDLGYYDDFKNQINE